MKDQFLYDAAPPIRHDFAEELYERISQPTPSRRPGLRWMGWNRKTLGYVAGFVVVTTIVGACAREIFRQRNVQVGEMWVLEGQRERVVRVHSFDQLDRPPSLLPPEAIPVAQALQTLPYGLVLPGWTPEGFSLVEETVPPPKYPDWSVNLNWVNQSGDGIFLWSLIWQVEISVPRGMWEEIEVNGRPAVLVRGRFPPFSQIPTPGPSGFSELEMSWDEEAGLSVIWTQGGAQLNLRTFGNYLSEEELIRMADSMGGS